MQLRVTDESAAPRNRHGLGAAAGMQLRENGFHVSLGGLQAAADVVGNHFVTQALHQQTQDFRLSECQGLIGHAGDQFFRDDGIERVRPLAGLARGANHFCGSR